MCKRIIASTTALVALAGAATAAPVLDGVKDAGLYQDTPVWSQNQPTGFGDNVQPEDPDCSAGVADAVNVATGAEFRIPLSALGNISGPIKLCSFLNGPPHDYVSNQISGGIGDGFGSPDLEAQNLGNPRGLDFNAVDLTQFVSLAGAPTATPAIDGTLDPAYGSPVFVQTSITRFGDGSDPAINANNGNEIDAFYAATDNDYLYLFVAGNLSSDFTKLIVFLDVDPARGQNQLRGDNPDVDFNGLNRMGNTTEGVTTDGLVFDTGFTADFFINLSTGNAGAGFASFSNVAEILDDPTGAIGAYIGGGTDTGSGGELIIDGDLGPEAGGIGAGFFVALNNSNTGGVTATCPGPLPLIGRDNAYGSELDAVYTHYDAAENELYVFLAGNLDNNGNKLVMFFDVGDTIDQVPYFGFPDPGQNELGEFNPSIDFGALQRLGPGDVDVDDDMDPNTPPVPTYLPGLTFDAGFQADQFLTLNISDAYNPNWYSNSAVLREFGYLVSLGGDTIDYGSYYGGYRNGGVPVIDYSGPLLQEPGSEIDIYANYAPRTATINNAIENPAIPVPGGLIRMSLDNSNTAGVSDVAVGNPASVGTGFEVVVDMDELGWDGSSEIKLCAFIVSPGYDFLSNQVTGGLPAADNLGEPRGLDFSAIAGNQYVVLPLYEGGGGQQYCVADVNTTNTNPGDPGYGESDGTVDGADLSYYVENWLGQNASVADVNTTNTNPGDPGYGAPDGTVDGADLSYYVEQWLAGSAGAGCP